MITEGDRPKPPELVSLYAAIPAVFGTLKEEFQVPNTYELVLYHVDAAEPFLRNTVDIAAITMRKIQALRWVAKPGVETTNAIVVTLAADLLRSLDYLVKCCNDQTNADSLTRFKHPIAPSESRPAQSGPLEREPYNSYETDSTNTSRKKKSVDNHNAAQLEWASQSLIWTLPVVVHVRQRTLPKIITTCEPTVRSVSCPSRLCRLHGWDR